VFTDVVSRRIVQTIDGHEVVRWSDVPIEVIARERVVTTDPSSRWSAASGATLARQHRPHTASARVV
jgi:hypothetical protein